MAQTHACDHDHDQPGLSGGALAAGLTAAEARCTAAGQRLTAPRRRVLELLLGAGQPANPAAPRDKVRRGVANGIQRGGRGGV